MQTKTHHQPTTSPEIGGVGHSIPRMEDARFIQGAGNYLDDVSLPGMLHMAILRSPVAHANLVSIDSSAAMELEGVLAVVTGELMAAHNLAWMPTLSGDTQAVLVTDKVRYQGQEVAAVIATDRYIAEDALKLIDVDYEELEPIINPQRSLEADAPVIRTDKEGTTDNVSFTWEAGDQAATDEAFARAARVVSLETHYPRSHPSPLEDVRESWRMCIRPPARPTPLHDVAGPPCPPDALRAGGGPARAEHQDHLPRPRRRVRQQGPHLSRICGGHRPRRS